MRKSGFISIAFFLFLMFLLAACNLRVAAPAVTEEPAETATEAPAGSGDARGLPAIDLNQLAAGATIRWFDNALLVFVPGGEFVMGGEDLDNPVHTVSVDDFWAYKTLVTNDMYRLCVSAGACTPPADELPIPDYLQPERKDHPVTSVTWEQAGEYCDWMNARLPTEAEWEKLARGEDGFTYPWGQAEPSCDLLNYEACELASTSRVYDYAAGLSPYEAADMAGNAYQWAGDWYAANYYDQAPETDPPGPENGTLHVVRGSSFRSPGDQLESALRYGIAPGTQRDDLGFRCVVAGDASLFAPFCQLTAFVPGPLDAVWVPEEGDPGAVEPMEPGTCEAEPPTASSTQYCADQGTSTGGATVIYSGELVEFDSGCIAGDSPIGCTGPEGTTLHITVCNACLGAGVAAVTIEPACAAGYTFADGICEYAGLPPLPGGDCPPGSFPDPESGLCQYALPLPDSDLCPEGYSFYEALSCCMAAFTDPLPDLPGIPPHSYPGCPLGTSYDEAAGLCRLEGELVPVTADCREFPVQLGYCAHPGDDDDGGCQVQACGGQNPQWCASLCACIGPADPCP